LVNLIQKKINSQGWILADGATGTNLFNMGLESGDPPEFWNINFPDRIKSLYRDSILAGCDLFLTNSFGGNSSRLALHNASDRARELSRLSAQLGAEVKNEFDHDIIMAGSVGPTGELMDPLGPLTFDKAVNIFSEQMLGLKEGGVDLVWIETMSAEEEYRAAAAAAKIVDIPWIGTMSFDTAGRTMMGITSTSFVEMVESLPDPPVAYGANCGVGASDLLRTVLGFRNAKFPIVAKGNAGIPKFVDGKIHYDGTPELMAKYAVMAFNCGAKIIGGCCGTTPKHIKAMRSGLEKCNEPITPDLNDIVANIGAFSSESDGTDGVVQRKRIRRGNR
jgi:5-methyltetrahydrofolate--homocysteine methyltransferase